MRLDFFLPVLRKPRKGLSPRSEGLCVRFFRRILPATLFDDLETGKPGLFRKTLKRLGPSWLAAPWRRLIQTFCFAAFLYLFFVVCWPYSATPARQWRGWRVVEQPTPSSWRLERTPDDITGLTRGRTIHVSDEFARDIPSSSIGPMIIQDVTPTTITLVPAPGFPSEQRAGLSPQSHPVWTLAEVPPGSWPAHYADSLAARERLHAEIFLILDPLVAISTSIASRTWAWSLSFAAGILLAGVLVPRGFCGYLCPLGTLIDLFDWSITKRITRFQVAEEGWWVHIKYYLLLGTLVASLCGVLVSGFVAAIPVITRGFLFLFEPLQTGLARGWHQVPPLHAGHLVSLLLFFTVLALGLLRPRFWCKYVCPSGVVFSLGNLFRISERKVEDSCIHCNKCVEICPFDAIKADFTTRETDCTLCQSCGGVCPTHAIKFVERWNLVSLKVKNDPPTHETPLGRRGFLSLAVGSTAGIAGGAGLAFATKTFGAHLDDSSSPRPVRPPGSVPEREFLQLCIRCGECFKACPNNVLQPLGFQQGLEGLWTPQVVADWAGCESSCNACGQVCPTGAIRALPLEEKRVARMGLAQVDLQTCLPHAGREACQLCVDECVHAGYNAIEFMQVHTEVTADGEPVAGTGYLAPVVLADKCVGCGLCQTRCYGINVAEKKLLDLSAIIIRAGEDREDRLFSGSYIELRRTEAAERARNHPHPAGPSDYLPDFLK